MEVTVYICPVCGDRVPLHLEERHGEPGYGNVHPKDVPDEALVAARAVAAQVNAALEQCDLTSKQKATIVARFIENLRA